MTNSYEEGFEERADHIDLYELERSTVEADFFNKIKKKLLQRGAKLIIGPRGTGKTHQMRYAYLQCINKKNNPIAIYVSFTKYYHLEPLLHKAPNALKLFHTWVLCKILLGCYDVLKDLKIGSEEFLEKHSSFDITELNKYVSQIEKGSILDSQNLLLTQLTLDTATNAINELIKTTKRRRAVLFFDDAALTLTHDYMIEFFDVFKALKSPTISPKASVYPGTTQYGPRFHVRHDAEPVDAWLSIEDPSYSEIMGEVVEKRINDVVNATPDIIELFKYAAFGIPRVLLTMLRNYEQSKGKTAQQKINSVITTQHTLLIAEYESLSLKLPQFKTVIETGLKLYIKIIDEITSENKKLSTKDEKQLRIGIQHNKEDGTLLVDRMIKLLIEVGLLHPIDSVSHGDNRDYDRYIPHLASLINNKAFSVGRGFSPRDIVDFINRRPTKHPLRRKFETLMPKTSLHNLKLDLPPCQVCNVPRLTESQKFCHSCGNALVEYSTFEQCMQIRIENLPLTKWQKSSIKKETDLATIKDFFAVQDPASELRKARGIGKVRSNKIYQVVLQEVEEFLS